MNPFDPFEVPKNTNWQSIHNIEWEWVDKNTKKPDEDWAIFSEEEKKWPIRPALSPIPWQVRPKHLSDKSKKQLLSNFNTEDDKAIITSLIENLPYYLELCRFHSMWQGPLGPAEVEQYIHYLWLCHRYPQVLVIPPTQEIIFAWGTHAIRTASYDGWCRKSFGGPVPPKVCALVRYVMDPSCFKPSEFVLAERLAKLHWKMSFRELRLVKTNLFLSPLDLSSYFAEDRQWFEDLNREAVRGIDDEEWVVQSIEKYLKFLSIAKEDFSQGPRINIDMCWHTHILTPGYQLDILLKTELQNIGHLPKPHSDPFLDPPRVNQLNDLFQLHFREGQAVVLTDPTARDPAKVLPRDVFLWMIENNDFSAIDLTFMSRVNRAWHKLCFQNNRWATLCEIWGTTLSPPRSVVNSKQAFFELFEKVHPTPFFSKRFEKQLFFRQKLEKALSPQICPPDLNNFFSCFMIMTPQVPFFNPNSLSK